MKEDLLDDIYIEEYLENAIDGEDVKENSGE